jgi:predicted dehydrogenase
MSSRKLIFGFIGCGLATFERAKGLPRDSVSYCLDGYDKIEKQFCKQFDAKSVSFENMVENSDAIFVCTPHDCLYEYAIKALAAGKHVLVEKPGAVTAAQLQSLHDEARVKNLVCHVGYTLGNVLFNENFLRMKPNSILANYCHGAREGYNNEWRMKSNENGGGVSYDLLTHITHMTLLCDPDMKYVNGMKSNIYWDSSGEDVATVMLKNNQTNAVASLFASCADWKKNFSIDLNYDNYKIDIKNINARNGDFTFVTHCNTGPGVIPETTSANLNGDFWIADTKIFLNKIQEGIATDLTNEINVLKIINMF